MSPTSYRTAPPRDNLTTLTHQMYHAGRAAGNYRLRFRPRLDTARSIFKTPILFMPKARAIAIAGAFAGGLLFAYTLHAAGLSIVLRQIRQIGAGFGVVLLLSGIRMAVRSQAWALCVERLERF